MKIKKININNFGLLSKKSINLESGINVIYSENKQIKTILQNFIVCFLYGMDNDRKVFKSVFRRRYSPFAMEKTKGELVVEKNNVEYLIERSFGNSKLQDTSSITRILDGEKIFNLNLDQPGKTFLDMGFEAFHRTMFVKNIDDFVLFNNNSKLMSDIVKIQENFDKRFSFDKAVDLINNAKSIIKDIRISENLNELYYKYLKLNGELHKANELVYLNFLDKNKLKDLNRRKEHLINEYSVVELNRKYFKYLELKTIVSNICDLECEIDKLTQDLKNINDDIPKLNDKSVTKDFVDNLKDKVDIYKECKKDILKINKLDLNEESKIFERFEYLNKELDKYSIVKSNLLFYTEKVKRIDDLNNQIDDIKGNGRLSYLLKNISRIKKSKQKKNYTKLYIFIIIFSILITILAPVFNLNVNGIILISLTSFILLGLIYVYSIFRDYKDIENKDMNIEASKFYDLKNQISKIEKELYPYTYYKIKKDVESIRKIEEELDTLSIRFKDGDLSYINVIKNFREQEKVLIEMLKDFNFEDIFIQDIENFIENIEFKLNHKKNVEKDLKDRNKELSDILEGKNKYDLINEMESLEEYSNVVVERTFDEVDNEYNILKIELKNIDEEILILKQNLENIDKNKRQVEIINGEIINLKNTIAYLESKITNVDMYINKITDIYYEFKENLSSEISMRIDYVIKYLTRDSLNSVQKNKVDKVMNNNGGLLLREKLGIEFLNAGMWDLIYFALRITIADLIYEDKGEIPFILDDLFVSYNFDKMKKALMLLEKYSKDRQVILFVSTKREIEYLKGNAYIVNI